MKIKDMNRIDREYYERRNNILHSNIISSICLVAFVIIVVILVILKIFGRV